MKYYLVFLSFLLSGCTSNHRIKVTEENDAIKYGPATDANYTQGLSVVVSSLDAYDPCDSGSVKDGDCQVDSSHKRIINHLNLFTEYENPKDKPVFISYGIAQQFYTPDDISIPEVIIDDRPYGGYLFGSVKIENVNASNAFDGEGDELRTAQLKLGLVGPLSFAEDIQSWWHSDVCDCTDPLGWNNQIKNEIGFVYSLRQENRQYVYEFDKGDWSADVISLAEASIGNVYTGVDLGAELRFGYGMPKTFSNDTIGPASTGFQKREVFFSYVFAGLTGRWVIRDIFLDGNLFTNSVHTVDKESFVGEFRVGGSVGFKEWALTVLFAHRTRQFELQRAPHKFGQIIISYTPNQD